MDPLFICPRCGNSNQRYIGHLNNKMYCRRCIAFNGEEAEASEDHDIDSVLDLDYDLSDEQKELSNQLIGLINEGKHVLIHAVTGAGKTEIVYQLIKLGLENHLKIGVAIPRRDVVIELARRFVSAFPHATVNAVYGGHHHILDGDIIILTTHQIYRYIAYFDRLVVDEYDAFPFKNNDVLETFLMRSLRGQLVAMSATPSKAMLEKFSKENHHILHLYTRYHRHPLPVPQVVRCPLLMQFLMTLKMIKIYAKAKKPLLIFVPTIARGESLFRWINYFIKGGALAHSQIDKRQEIVEAFRQKKFDFLVSTSILERGITLLNLQVIIFNADHGLFDEATLLQMAGRVGRKSLAPTGEVIFLSKRKTKSMIGAINQTNHANSFL